jgi:hypothetical protein
MLQLGQLGLMQHFAQTQQQNWGMGSMNGMGMRDMVTGMQNMQNMQHRYPVERESESESVSESESERERERARESGGMKGGDIEGGRG